MYTAVASLGAIEIALNYRQVQSLLPFGGGDTLMVWMSVAEVPFAETRTVAQTGRKGLGGVAVPRLPPAEADAKQENVAAVEVYTTAKERAGCDGPTGFPN
ncbi:MAG: hypothetical protein GF331_07410 [Chitinivibrionales bacterium]|nr:hypothetical protein [Chitinivibrionales bacterium]